MAKKRRNALDPLEQGGAKMAGAAKHTVDAVLASLKAGSTAVSLLSGLLASVLILYSSYVLYDSFATSYRAYSSSWDLLQYKPEIISEGANPSEGQESLEAINRDYRGWLTVYDSSIDYPVVQGENDLYYASHDVYQNVSLTGSIYLAAGNNPDMTDTYNLIYGHHMDNGAMFGSLDQFRDEAFYAAHREGILVSRTGVYDLTVFAVAETDAYENEIYTVGNRAAEVKAFLTGDRDHDAGLGTRVLTYDHAVGDSAERILALSTCDSAETNGRLVVFAKMTPRALPTFTPAPDPVVITLKPAPTATPTPRANSSGSGSATATATPTPHHDAVPTPTPNRGPFNLQVRYEFLDGSTAHATYYGQYMAGEEYSIDTPQIQGYITARVVVHGTMGNQDVVIVVLYIPIPMAELGKTISIDEYEVPLGLDDLHAQMGVCVE